MVRLFTLVFLLATFTVQAQIGKTETEDYKAGFEQKADIDEVSDYAWSSASNSELDPVWKVAAGIAMTLSKISPDNRASIDVEIKFIT